MKLFFMPALAAAGFTTAAQAEERHEHHHDSRDSIHPELSFVFDGLYYYDTSDEGLPHLKEEMPGFGHGHGEHTHDLDNGFNLRHVELQFAGQVDEWVRFAAVAAVDVDGAELEVAEVETLGLPWGLTAKVGKFYSGFDPFNRLHTHAWGFSDAPLIHELLFGEHGLNETGMQLTWQPTDRPILEVGTELLQGVNEQIFAVAEDEGLDKPGGPRLGTGWVRWTQPLNERHQLQLGFFGAGGNHQEIHEEGGTTNRYDGLSWFAGTDAAYAYRSGQPHGYGDFTLQTEYIYREKRPEQVGGAGRLESRQNGFYAEARYGILPRWTAGLRWDQVGLINELKEPGEAAETFGDSRRLAALIELRPSNALRLRVQVNHGDYDTADGQEEAWEGFLQLTVLLGSRHVHDESCTH